MKLYYLDEIDSTNKYTKSNIDKFEDMSLIYTSKQTDGIGRLGRKWVYLGDDNIYATLVLKPSEAFDEKYSNLTQYLSIIIAETLEEYGVKTEIKWPNDIKVNNKKICGILAEAIMDYEKLKGIIIGFGINLNCSEFDTQNINQPATSLNIEIKKSVDKKEFINKLTKNFCLRYNNFIKEGFIYIKQEYLKRLNIVDKEVSIKNFDKTVSGKVIGITDNGALKIKDKNNKEQIILMGDIL